VTGFGYPYEVLPGTGRTYLVDGGLGRLEVADAFVREMHVASGLWRDLDPDNDRKRRSSLLEIEEDLLRLSSTWPTERGRKLLVAGNSCHFDLEFLRARMPRFASRLSHRTFDASAFYAFTRSLGMPPIAKPTISHRAEDDVEKTLRLARTCARWALDRWVVPSEDEP